MALNAEVTAIMGTFDSGDRNSAKKQLADLVSKTPEFKHEADTIRFRWLAKEDPTAWVAKAKEMAKNNDEPSRMMLLNYALAGGDLVLGRKSLDLVLAATKGKDLLTLRYANAFYNQTKEYSLALEALNHAIDLVPAKDSELKESLEKMKKETQDKLEKQKSH
jgi:hypothetical protein